MSYAEGTPERELQIAVEDLGACIEKVARLNGSVPDGFYISDWAAVGAAISMEQVETSMLFAIPGSRMATYQLHGLLDTCDKWILSGDSDLDSDTEESSD